MNIGKSCRLPLCNLIGNFRTYLYIVSLVVILSNWVCDNWVYRFPMFMFVPERSGSSLDSIKGRVLGKVGNRGGVQKSMGHKVPWKIGMLIYLPGVTSRPLMFC